MDVSIVIINFNTFQLTCNCIASVYSQTSGIVFEVILVDNASTECDADLFKEKFPGLILIKNKVNEGFSKGNNHGIRQSSSPVILLLNSDTKLENNAIKIALETIKSNESLGALTVKLLFPDGQIQKQCERFPSLVLILLEKLRLHKLLSLSQRGKLFLGAYFDHTVYVESDTIWGTFFMLKRSVMEQMPGKKLNDSYFMYYEDNQWCFDIKKLGYKIAYEPKGVVTHYLGSSNGPREVEIVKNNIYFLKNNFSRIKVVLLKWLGYF